MSKAISTIVIFALTIGLFFFYLIPAWGEFQKTRKADQELQQVLVELDDLIRKRDTWIELVNKVSKTDLDRINQAIPRGRQDKNILVLTEELVKKHGLVLRGIDVVTTAESKSAPPAGQPRPSAEPETTLIPEVVKSVTFNVSVFGGYQFFKNLLSDLERTLPLVDIQEIVFSSAGQGNSFEFKLKAKTYYQ